ncbi:MAG: apolipoprotein N-acyltransferase [Motiliproteus sp.]
MPVNFNGLKGFNGHLLALLAGLIAPLGFAPFQYWAVSVLSCLLFLYSLANTDIKTASFRGWLYGVGFFGAGVSWVYVSINQFGHAAPWLAGLLTFIFVCAIAPFFAIQAALYRLIAGSEAASHKCYMWMGFPAVWVLSEWFRSWFLTGFPWNYLGYAPIDSWLGSWAPITGVYGLSFCTALLASSIYLLLQRPKQKLFIAALAGLILPAFLGLLLTQKTWIQPSTAAPLKVALVQGNTPQNLKWNPDYRQHIIDSYIKSTLMNLDRDLIIWPETAIPRLLVNVRPALVPLEELLNESGIGLITGVPTHTGSGQQKQYFNSVVGLASAQGIYHKQRLVPFGEYVPLEDMLRGLITFFDLPMSSFSLGPANQPPMRLSNGQQLASFVCYEIVYPDLVANDSRNADYLLTLSNDSWFGDSLAPHQHLQMARMRAKENGRYLIRATNNGISAIIDANGNILKQTEQFVAEVLRAEVIAMTGNTPFSRFGSVPVLSFCLLICIALFTSNQATRKRHHRT